MTSDIDCRKLEWQACETLKQTFDIILCSDLVYGDSKSAGLLVHVLQTLGHADTVIVSAHECRYAGDQGEAFFSFLQQTGFRVQSVPHEMHHPEYQCPNIHINIISK